MNSTYRNRARRRLRRGTGALFLTGIAVLGAPALASAYTYSGRTTQHMTIRLTALAGLAVKRVDYAYSARCSRAGATFKQFGHIRFRAP